MATRGYWDSLIHARIARRRLLAASGGAGAAAVALGIAGCGGGDAGPSEPFDQSGLLSKPVDTTDKAVQGGVMKDFQNAEVIHFDALLSNSSQTVNNGSLFAYPRLTKRHR